MSAETRPASERATTGSATPILRVESLEASIDYYASRLGFEVQWRASGVASMKRDRTSIIFCEGDQGHSGTWVWMSTSDVDGLYAELESRGARLRHPPTNYPWGSRECQVTDLDGHVLRFGADLRAGEPTGTWRDGDGRLWAPQPNGAWRLVDEI